MRVIGASPADFRQTGALGNFFSLPGSKVGRKGRRVGTAAGLPRALGSAKDPLGDIPRKVVNALGGRAARVGNERADGTDRLADRLTSEMMIEYLVPVGSKANDVKVGVRLAGAKVRGLGVAPR